MKQKTRKTAKQSSHLYLASACLLILSLLLSALPVGSSLAAPSDPGGMSLLGEVQPMGGLGEGSLCVTHTWVDVTSYKVKGTIGSTPKEFLTARSKLTFPDNSVKYAFCTDIHHTVGSNQTYCLDSGFYSDWRIAWLVNNYPPIEDQELNAARQAAVWHFSDGFNLSQSDPTTSNDPSIDSEVLTHYNAILSSIPAQMPPEYGAGNVSITITPQNATNFLPGQEAHSFTVTLTKGSQPLAGKTINVSTTFGTLDQTSKVTDANGQASFTVTSSADGSATLTATAKVLVPAGSRFLHQSDPNGKQRLVLGEPITTTVQATASKTWVNATNLIIAHKFEDKNYNGVQDAGEPNLEGWTFTLTDPNGNTVTATTNALGKAYFYNQVSTNGTYTLTETLKPNWTNSTPLSQTCNRANGSGCEQWIAHFGNAQYSLITVIKYEDKNGNKQKDADEPTLPGWQFYLYRKSDIAWLQVTGGTTGVDGSLSFSDLDAGDYKVAEFLTDPEYYNTSGLTQTLTLGYPKHETLYFGNRRYDMDYGDLPNAIQGNPAYQLTLFTDNGARHKPLGEGDVWLGNLRDAEYDGNPHSGATGDDGHHQNDEDGVVRGASWGGGTGSVFVTVNGPACLMGWVDFAKVNDSHQFTGFGPDFKFTQVISGTQTYNELIIDNLYLDTGGLITKTHEVSFPLPPEFASTVVFARFRLSPYDASKGKTKDGKCKQSPAGLDGLVIGGEVEDYYWGFGPTAVELKKISVTPQRATFSFGLIAIAVGTTLAAAWVGRRRPKASE